MSTSLPDRTVISVTGTDAKAFLQGLVTNDVLALRPDRPLYAALLTPQGKILFDFLLFEKDSEVLIDCWKPSTDALLRRLTMYRLRAKAEIEFRQDLSVHWSRETNLDGSPDPRLPELGWRTIGKPASDIDNAYLIHRLSLGVPEGGDFGSDRMFALDADLEELHGVSFAKGCYVGQELTARMKHRGTARKRLLHLVSRDGRDLSPVGTEIRAGEISLGEITAAYGAQGFGLIRLDRLRDTQILPAMAGETAIRISIPGWIDLKA